MTMRRFGQFPSPLDGLQSGFLGAIVPSSHCKRHVGTPLEDEKPHDKEDG